MTFEDFAKAHGLIINSLTPGKWMAVPTEDHPRKRNGRYKWLGDVGWVQNWATMTSPEIWRGQDARPVAQMIQKADKDRLESAQRAAQKAGWILHQCNPEPHPYLSRKGFPEEVGNVWSTDGKQLLVIPMRVGPKLVGLQLVDHEGNKKFLQGQQTKGASFILDARGVPIFCEGYATALSVRAVMKVMKVRYTIYVCFSAGNLKEVARNIAGGIIVADNDPNGVGEQAARQASKPYWLSDAVGEDFNDYHLRVGLFKAMGSLKKAVFSDASVGETSPQFASGARG